MTEQFDIIDIGRCPEVYSEQMGSKDKFWIEYGEEYWLYKVPRPHTGEHWAERVVADIALILGIPAALVELAERDGSRGTISKSFLRQGETLIHGNELMARYVPTYEMGKRFGQREHRLDLVLECIEQTAELGPGGNHPASAVDAFVGYLFLDALVGNTDRHHENWAVIRSATQQTRLAPSYDHASSLGRELQDKRRMDKLRSRGIGHYLAGGGGGLFTRSAAKAPPPLNLLGDLDSLGYGDYKSRWKAVVAAADIEELCGAICKIPPSWMSDEARTFATAIVRHQYQAITGS